MRKSVLHIVIFICLINFFPSFPCNFIQIFLLLAFQCQTYCFCFRSLPFGGWFLKTTKKMHTQFVMYTDARTYVHLQTYIHTSAYKQHSIQVYCEANCVKYNYFVKLTNVTRRMRKPFFFAAGYICTYLLRYFSLPRSFMKREIVLN